MALNHHQRLFNTRLTVRFNNTLVKWEVMAKGPLLMTLPLPLVTKLRNRHNMGLVAIRRFILQVCLGYTRYGSDYSMSEKSTGDNILFRFIWVISYDSGSFFVSKLK